MHSVPQDISRNKSVFKRSALCCVTHDVFERHQQLHFMSRLLCDTSRSFSCEQSAINILRPFVSYSFANKLEGMLEDILNLAFQPSRASVSAIALAEIPFDTPEELTLVMHLCPPEPFSWTVENLPVRCVACDMIPNAECVEAPGLDSPHLSLMNLFVGSVSEESFCPIRKSERSFVGNPSSKHGCRTFSLLNKTKKKTRMISSSRLMNFLSPT